jgi:hypothetical protein
VTDSETGTTCLFYAIDFQQSSPVNVKCVEHLNQNFILCTLYSLPTANLCPASTVTTISLPAAILYLNHPEINASHIQIQELLPY